MNEYIAFYDLDRIYSISKETAVFDRMKAEGGIEKSPVRKMFTNRSSIVFGFMITAGLLFMNTATASFYRRSERKEKPAEYFNYWILCALCCQK